MEFGRARGNGKAVVGGVLFVLLVIAAGAAGVWWIWDTYLSENFGVIVEFLN